MPRRLTVATWSALVVLALMNVYLLTNRPTSSTACSPCTVFVNNPADPSRIGSYHSPTKEPPPVEPRNTQPERPAKVKETETPEDGKYVPPPEEMNTMKKSCTLMLIATANDGWRLP